MNFITNATTENTGGNCMADTFQLKSGGTLFITDEMIGIAPGSTWHDGPSEDYRGFDYETVGCVARTETEKPFTFVSAIDVYEPDGPVSVDLILLADGRVLGVDSETAVLYPSREAFEAFDGSTEYPTISL